MVSYILPECNSHFSVMQQEIHLKYNNIKQLDVVVEERT